MPSRPYRATRVTTSKPNLSQVGPQREPPAKEKRLRDQTPGPNQIVPLIAGTPLTLRSGLRMRHMANVAEHAK
ncbi:hypothetical protein RBSWK_03663 [Rhodopirellula baltica SWK14]|uniref:Uncharacterized protein n=1 Tax=Rhodopirellula baltica SWK14 TaxID=993516 RepID=L7CDQ6_RHOBT|nr:hypothetical protein RBSWK_03663 [Rhodopirellula baltica SWK14]